VAGRPPRTLRPDEVQLWEKVVEKAAPLHPNRPVLENNKTISQTNPANQPVQRFVFGASPRKAPIRLDVQPGIFERIARQPVAMDRKRFVKMKRGRLAPEARIDLHGLTIAQAHPTLTRFILESVADGRRLVLVITGKGKTKPDHGPIPERHGALRHQVPHWLHSAPLKPHVLQIAEAHVKHGGHGAYYVYLRRSR
jgi:DNA-nicking Smr family endonuclease